MMKAAGIGGEQRQQICRGPDAGEAQCAPRALGKARREMALDRREALRRLGRAAIVSAAFSSPVLAARAKRLPAALIVPLTGPRAGLGLSMQCAALLAERMSARSPCSTAQWRRRCRAAQAVRRGAKLILGPIFAEEVRPVLAAVAGRAPVLSFSNDVALRESGAFLLGVSADQLVTAVLGYARGARRQDCGDRRRRHRLDDAGGQRGGEPAGGLGITVRRLVPGETLRADTADALLAAEGGDAFLASAQMARAAGVQLLGTVQALDYRPAALAAAEGAWLAAPDPDGFAAFADAYAGSSGSALGLLAGLAYDATMIAARVGAGGRAALLSPAGFPGVTGAVRFRADGSAARRLAILLAGREGYATVATSAPA